MSKPARAVRRPCSTSSVAAAMVPTMPIGRLNQKTVCQPKLGQPAAEDRPEDQPGPDDHRVDAERAAELAARERVGDEGGRVGHQERAADALDEPGDDEQERRSGRARRRPRRP